MHRTAAEPHAITPAVAWGTAFRGAIRPEALVQSTAAAFIVGSILFIVNLYSHVRADPFTAELAVRVALTFLVPWANATIGIAIGLRKSVASPRHHHARPIER